MSTIGSDTPCTSRDLALTDKRDLDGVPQRKVLEEEEYLGRMAKIIKRDFFSGPELESFDGDSTPNMTEPSTTDSRSYADTPGTGRTGISTTSSIKSRREACSMRLNEFLSKYTSEDNAYFDKLQAKELKRHRLRFPWLYRNRKENNKTNTLAHDQALRIDKKGDVKMIGSSNTLLITGNPDDSRISQHTNYTSTVNYESSKYMREPIFKNPFPVTDRPRSVKNRFTDKIGIDGKLLNGSETPSMNGYSYIPPPETPKLPVAQSASVKQENCFFLPGESPRDALAHRLYEDKIARKIRTPSSSTRSDSTRTPKSKLDKIF